MRIAFSVCNIGFGHSTRSLYVMEELKKRGHNIHVMVGKPYDEFFRKRGYDTTTLHKPMNLYEDVGKNFKKTVKFSYRSTPKLFSSIVNARKIIKKTDPDLLVSDSEPGSVLSTRSVKKVMITHQPELFVRDRLSRVNVVWRKVLGRCERVVVPDVIGVPVPGEIEDRVERVGPLADEVEEGTKELRERFGMAGGTVLMLPSFTGKEHEKALRVARSLDRNFVFLGQEETKEMENVKLKKKEDVENSCEYIKASDVVVLSGYTSLMESVYYQKPVFLVPTQFEQRKVGELGKVKGILEVGGLSAPEISSFLENEKLRKEIRRGQSRYQSNGANECADIIEGMED